MRVYDFTFGKEDERDYAMNGFVQMFKNCKDFKSKKITISKSNQDEKFKLFVSIDDVVAGSYSFIIQNAFDRVLKISFISVKDEADDVVVEFPPDVIIMSWYSKDVT